MLSFAVGQVTVELAMSRKPCRGHAPSDLKYRGNGQFFAKTTFPNAAPWSSEDLYDELGG
jgi:hypothetical protein